MNDQHHDDVLSEDALAGVQLPGPTLTALSETGVPRELRLPGWPGPTLFSSEIGHGRLVATTDKGAIIARAGEREGYLVGSVRDVGPTPTLYGAFCLSRFRAEVFLLDANDPSEDRFVNASLAVFLASLRAFHAAFGELTADRDDHDDLVDSFRKLLLRLDPRALDTSEHYWPGWLEALA